MFKYLKKALVFSSCLCILSSVHGMNSTPIESAYQAKINKMEYAFEKARRANDPQRLTDFITHFSSSIDNLEEPLIATNLNIQQYKVLTLYKIMIANNLWWAGQYKIFTQK